MTETDALLATVEQEGWKVEQGVTRAPWRKLWIARLDGTSLYDGDYERLLNRALEWKQSRYRPHKENM